MTRAQVAAFAERVGWTAAQAFAASLLVTQTLNATTLEVAGTAAVLAAAKCLVGLRIGDGDGSIP
jgi:hypothetical protein